MESVAGGGVMGWKGEKIRSALVKERDKNLGVFPKGRQGKSNKYKFGTLSKSKYLLFTPWFVRGHR